MYSSTLILASSSHYRRQILSKLAVDFIADAPEIDESRQVDEAPDQLALRLGIQKAWALQEKYPNHLIIASDQVAFNRQQQLHKPGNRAQAIKQLQDAVGQSIQFFTSICVHNSATQQTLTELDITTVHFKQLTNVQIEHYIDIDQPFDCAGSFKAESLGIALFEKIQSDDPNALIGLPLIKLIALLEQFDFKIL